MLVIAKHYEVIINLSLLYIESSQSYGQLISYVYNYTHGIPYKTTFVNAAELLSIATQWWILFVLIDLNFIKLQ